MARRIRWQIVLALAGTVAILLLIGSVVLTNASRSIPVSGQTYVEGVVGVATQLNPLAQTAAALPSERDLAALLFEGLTRSSPNGQIVPALAERWTISPNNLVYTFTLRSGLRWHDGVPLTADDVAWTIRSVLNADFPGDPALPEVWRNVLVEPLDDRRVQLTQREPFAPLLAATTLPILPAHVLENIPPGQWASAPFSRAPVGSGPFRLERLTASEALLRPFEGAVRGRPVLDLLVLRFFASETAMRTALQRRDLDGIAQLAGPTAPVRAGSRKLETRSAHLAAYTTLTFNLTEPPLDDLALRRVLSQALDRNVLIERLLGGVAQPLETPILPQSWAADRTVRLPAFDTAAAARQLDALGWQRGPDGLRRRDDQVLRLPITVVNTPEQVAIAAEIVRQWNAIGIDSSIEAVPADQLRDQLKAHAFRVGLHSWSDTGIDPDVYALWHSSQAQGGANYAGLEDDGIDQLLIEGRTTTDPDERLLIYADFQRRWASLVPSLPLFQSQLVYTFDSLRLPPEFADALLPNQAARFNSVSGWSVAR